MAQVYSQKCLKSTDLGRIFPFGFENLPIGLTVKKTISFWIKKTSLWSGQTKSEMAIMIHGHLMTFRADAMNGAAGIFPPKIPRPLS